MPHFASVTKSKSKVRNLSVQNVIGFPISAISFQKHVEVIVQWAQQRRTSKVVCVSNVHMVMEGRWNQDFSQVLLQADLLTPDGMPLVWMTRFLKGRSQDRVAGLELMTALCEKAEALNLSIFFLGSKPEVLENIRKRLEREYPNLRVAGMVSPPFRALNDLEDDALIQTINASRADLLFVSLGCPKQEYWMHQHKDKITSVMVGLGGAFLIFSGFMPWAPKWIRQFGMEWAYRLTKEPKRLWRRYATTIPPFIFLACKQLVQVRLGLIQPNTPVSSPVSSAVSSAAPSPVSSSATSSTSSSAHHT